MKYILRLFIYLVVFTITFSLGTVLAFRFVPVTITPFQISKLLDHRKDVGFKVKSAWTPIDRISIQMQKAVIATEDNNFMSHNGFDLEAIKIAMEENREGKRLRGGSTISQQTAKNVFCPPSRTWLRKAVETYYTVLIETFWGKERIMEVYLNVIEVNKGMYGVQAASKEFYSKDALELNNYEAAMIATVLPNPIRMNLGAPSNYMTRRAARVRQLMGAVEVPQY